MNSLFPDHASIPFSQKDIDDMNMVAKSLGEVDGHIVLEEKDDRMCNSQFNFMTKHDTALKIVEHNTGGPTPRNLPNEETRNSEEDPTVKRSNSNTDCKPSPRASLQSNANDHHGEVANREKLASFGKS